MAIILFLIIVFLIVVVRYRTMNENYTSGSGMFKNSEHNLNKDDHLDVSDYNYYNDKDKMK